MATEIGVHTGQMGNDIRSLDTLIGKMRTDVAQLQKVMDNMNRMWQGSANTVMRLRFQGDYEEAQALCRMFGEMVQDLEEIRQAYEACEIQVSGQIRALSVL